MLKSKFKHLFFLSVFVLLVSYQFDMYAISYDVGDLDNGQVAYVDSHDVVNSQITLIFPDDATWTYTVGYVPSMLVATNAYEEDNLFIGYKLTWNFAKSRFEFDKDYFLQRISSDLSDNYDKGYAAGILVDNQIAYESGRLQGYVDAEEELRQLIEDEYFTKGYAKAELDLTEDIQDEYYDLGYLDGLEDGYSSSESETVLLTFFGSVLGAAFSFVWLFLTEPAIFGINILDILLLFVGVVIIFALIRKFV